MGKNKNIETTIWTFTNKKELNKSEFFNFFERKVFRTIRKFRMLPINKIFIFDKTDTLNTIVLKQILETKFKVEKKSIPNISSDNLSQTAENIFKNITKGNFNYQIQTSAPLLYLSDKEIELYAKLKNIKGESRKSDRNIQKLFKNFLGKNQDLEINILKAQEQINNIHK